MTVTLFVLDLFIFISMNVLSECMDCIKCMTGAHGCPKTESDPLNCSYGWL